MGSDCVLWRRAPRKNTENTCSKWCNCKTLICNLNISRLYVGFIDMPYNFTRIQTDGDNPCVFIPASCNAIIMSSCHT